MHRHFQFSVPSDCQTANWLAVRCPADDRLVASLFVNWVGTRCWNVNCKGYMDDALISALVLWLAGLLLPSSSLIYTSLRSRSDVDLLLLDLLVGLVCCLLGLSGGLAQRLVGGLSGLFGLALDFAL